MNTIKKTIGIAIFIFCTHFTYSQKFGFSTPEEKLKFQKHTMDRAPFIFEGTVTSQKCYRNGTILTCSTIEITKILKGSDQIKLGTIKIITHQGGSVPEEHSGNENYLIDEETISDGSGINKGTYIIFATPANSSKFGSSNSPVKMLTTDNTLVIELVDLIKFNSSSKSYFWESFEVNYKTSDELYSFLKDNGGLIVQEEKK